MSENNTAANDPLNGLLGGPPQNAFAAGALGSNSFLAPIVKSIAARLGIPPQIAGVLVSFGLAQLMGARRDPQLAQILGGKGTVSQGYLRDSGMVAQLAQETGLDDKTVTVGLQQVMQAFGTQMSTGTREDRQVGLENWLSAG